MRLLCLELVIVCFRHLYGGNSEHSIEARQFQRHLLLLDLSLLRLCHLLNVLGNTIGVV